MSHTFARIHVHIIFSTKERRPTIHKQIQPELWAYMVGICRNKGIEAIAINGVSNHVHALIHLPPAIQLAKAVNFLKSNSSRWMSEHGRKFDWQDGYGAFSVSESNRASVIRYIRDQEKHHRKFSFEQEYITFLKKHGFEYDPRYVFG
jgi:REP element-mobilizing transposase RayT